MDKLIHTWVEWNTYNTINNLPLMKVGTVHSIYNALDN